jgi:hypothetical protein
MLFVIFVYDQISCLHFFQTLRQHRRVAVDDHHLDAVVHQLTVHLFLEYLFCMENYLAHQMCEVQNHFLRQVHQYAVYQDELQNLDVQNLDESQPSQNEVVLLENLVVFVVDAELRHQLKMDCYLDVVDAELRYQLKMDCYLDVLQVLVELPAMLELLQQLMIHRR